MLSLTMRSGEYLLIGNDIKITFQGANGGNSVSIGVEAPKSIKVTRSALYEKIIDEKVSMGDKKAIEISQALSANKFEREQDILRKKQLTLQIKEHKARQRARKLETINIETP